MKIKPLRNQVAVKFVEPEEKTAGGLFIPEVAKKPAQLADVVAVGPGQRLRDGSYAPLGFGEGDRVLVNSEYTKGFKYVDTPILVDGAEVFLVNGESILGVVSCD